MLYVILDNGEFLTLLEGTSGRDMLGCMREYDESGSNDLTSFLVDRKGFQKIAYNEIETVQPPSADEKERVEGDLSVVLDDGELLTVVRGERSKELYGQVVEFFESDAEGSLNEFLTTKGFEIVEIEVFDFLDVRGAMYYAQHGIRPIRIFTN